MSSNTLPADIARLQALIAHTGLTPREVLRRYKGEAAPEGLRYHHVEAWLAGSLERVPLDHVAFVLDLWRAVPEDDYIIDITAETRELLKGYQRSTGVGPHKLLRRRSDVPQDVSAARIQGWILGRLTRARCGALHYVLAAWARSPSFVLLGPEVRAQIAAEHSRTGLAGARLLKGARDKPEGLTAGVINNWLSGAAQSARSDHLEYVLQLWRAIG